MAKKHYVTIIISLKRKIPVSVSGMFLSCIMLFSFSFFSISQNLPIIHPGFTNSFFYNPSLAGSSSSRLGSLSIIHKENFSDVTGHPKCDIISVHMPNKKFKYGWGANLYYEKVNAFQTIYGSVSYAYHLSFGYDKKLSFGLSGNVFHKHLNYSEVKVLDKNEYDLTIEKYTDGKFNMDFSIGVNYQANRFMIGSTFNNVFSSGIFHKEENIAPINYYSAYIKYIVPISHGCNQLEPFIALRQMPLSTPLCNIGCSFFYTIRNSLLKTTDRYLTAGWAVGTNSNMSFSLGINIRKRMHIIYNYEVSGKYSMYFGNTNEIILQYNFINQTYMERITEYLNWDNNKIKRKRKIDKFFK